MTQAYNEEFQPISLADLWNLIVRRKVTILLMCLLAVLVACSYLKTAHKKYNAQAVVLLDNQQKNLQIENLLGERGTDSAYVSSEIQILLSRELMRDVLTQLDLFNNANLLWPPKSPVRALSAKIGKKTPSKKKKPSQSTAERKSTSENKLIAFAIRNLKITQIEKSNAIEVTFTSYNRDLAATLVNTLVELYIKDSLSDDQSTVSNTNKWLKQRVQELRKNVTRADTRIVEHRKQYGFVDSNGIALIENEIAQISRNMIDAQTTLSRAQVKWDEINSPQSRDTAPQVLASSIIQKLIERQSDIKSRVADLRKIYGSEHPEMIAASSTLNEINAKIDLEINKIAVSLKREYNIAKSSAEEIELQLDTLKTQYNDLKVQNIRLQEMEREAENSKTLLAKLDLRWREIEVQEDKQIKEPYARILSRAVQPTEPTSPKPKLVIIVALIGGLGLGLAFAIIMDYLQTGIYNGKQLQQHTALPNIALIPNVGGKKSAHIKKSVKTLSNAPLSAYTESLRSLSAYLRNKINTDSATIFNFTSVYSQEGKSAIVAAAARQLTLEGKSVLVIDCDLRNPALGEAFDLKSKQGLSDVLNKSVKIDSVIYKDKESDIDIIGIGSITDVNVINKGAHIWQNIKAEMGTRYDVILLNGPAAQHISDMSILAQGTQNILCVCWKKTPAKQIMFAQHVLEELGFSLLGTVVTLVKPSKIKQLTHYY
ncbi:MAG: exopolysaccharide transport family protein [Alphaproteobacteria bacterium]